MKIYTFDKTDCGIFGKAFEMAIKDALRRKNADRVSPCGVADFRYNCKNYDTKQNGSCIRYSNDTGYIRGSNRVIYATHIAHTIVRKLIPTSLWLLTSPQPICMCWIKASLLPSCWKLTA